MHKDTVYLLDSFLVDNTVFGGRLWWIKYHSQRFSPIITLVIPMLMYYRSTIQNLEWLFRFIRKKRGKSSKPSEESSSASAKTDETNRSATNLEKIQPEFSGAVTT